MEKLWAAAADISISHSPVSSFLLSCQELDEKIDPFHVYVVNMNLQLA